MEANTSIVQWNVQGISNKKDEIVDLINRYRACVLAIQETKASDQFLPRIPNYNVISKLGHFNRTHHGGVALYIHSSIPFRQIELNTPVQAIAIQVNLRSKHPPAQDDGDDWASSPLNWPDTGA